MHLKYSKSILWLILLFSLVGSKSLLAQAIRYVKPTQAGSGNGLSWDDASADVQAMINAVSQAGGVVLVSGGVYKPTPGSSRYASFSILSGVAVYGNCSGTETGPEQRTLTNQTGRASCRERVCSTV